MGPQRPEEELRPPPRVAATGRRTRRRSRGLRGCRWALQLPQQQQRRRWRCQRKERRRQQRQPGPRGRLSSPTPTSRSGRLGACPAGPPIRSRLAPRSSSSQWANAGIVFVSGQRLSQIQSCVIIAYLSDIAVLDARSRRVPRTDAGSLTTSFSTRRALDRKTRRRIPCRSSPGGRNQNGEVFCLLCYASLVQVKTAAWLNRCVLFWTVEGRTRSFALKLSILLASSVGKLMTSHLADWGVMFRHIRHRM